MFINRQKVQEVIMGHIIAISGKDGVGKTTLCGLLIQYLCETGKNRCWLWMQMQMQM